MVQSRKNIFKDTLLIYEKDESPLFPALSRPNVTYLVLEEPEEDTPVEQIIEEPIEVEDVFVAASYMKKFAFAVPAFVFVFAIAFSLNGSYTGGLIKQGLASAAASPVGETVGSEILLPYKLAAKQLADSVDDVTFKIFYAP